MLEVVAERPPPEVEVLAVARVLIELLNLIEEVCCKVIGQRKAARMRRKFLEALSDCGGQLFERGTDDRVGSGFGIIRNREGAGPVLLHAPIVDGEGEAVPEIGLICVPLEMRLAAKLVGALLINEAPTGPVD